MIFPVHDFEKKWYSAQKFGNKTTYGYHDGEDINFLTGGDSDLGQPLLAIANGEVTSVHSHTTKPTFGNHVHIKHTGPWGEVYSHYAHCRDIYVKTGDKVNEGQVIATVGKSGTDFAHLHFAIKLQPTGVDGIAKTQEDLKKWTDPIAFINKWSQVPQEDMLPNYFKTLLQENNLSLDRESEMRTWFDKARKYDEDTNSLRQQVVSANEALSGKTGEVAMLVEKNQKLTDRATEAEETLNRVRSERDTFSWEATQYKIKNESLETQVKTLEAKVSELEKEQGFRVLFNLGGLVIARKV